MLKSLVKNYYERFLTLFSILKTSFKPVDYGNKSFIQKDNYPELALKAALDSNIYKIFRRHYIYTTVLEYVGNSLGQKYLDHIFQDYNLSESEIFSIVEPLQTIGAPRKFKPLSLNLPISLTSLRYLKIGLDIKKRYVKKIPNVVEIGYGYGGQAIILSRILEIDNYTFFYIRQVNLLIKRFIEDFNFTPKHKIITLGEYQKANKFDLCISNYAFSKLPYQIQEKYFKEVLLNSSSGFMIMNSGDDGNFGDIINMSKKELLKLSSSQFHEEIPKSGSKNYLIKWKAS